MKLVIQFDCDADIIDVPPYVINNKEQMRKRFLKWLYNKNNAHCYWVNYRGSVGVKYRGDAFVEWLNKKILCKCTDVATLQEEHVVDVPNDLPVILF